MAPTFEQINIYNRTVFATGYVCGSLQYANIQYANLRRSSCVQNVETKKERIARIAKYKMLASWKTYNQKTEKIIKMKQICKPRHRLVIIGVVT